MLEVHHFAYGWINPVIGYAMSFLGSLLGLVLAGRVREVGGARRLRWLAAAALALGGTGVWLMQFMALLGFDVSGTMLRYDLRFVAASALIAVLVAAVGLLVVCTGRHPVPRVVLGGLVTGLGLVATHAVAVAGVRLGGRISFDGRLMGLSAVIAVIAATLALGAVVTVRDARETVGAAVLTAVAVCSAHYSAMASVRVTANPDLTATGVSPFVLLVPICILATVVIAALALGTVGVALHQENARADALLTPANPPDNPSRRDNPSRSDHPSQADNPSRSGRPEPVGQPPR